MNVFNIFIFSSILIIQINTNAQGFWQQSGLDNNSIGYITSDTNGRLYASLQVWDSLYISDDSGETWQFLSEIDPIIEYTFVTSIIFDNEIFVSTLLGGSGIYKSTDYGKSWVPKNNGLQTNDVSKIIKKSDSLFAGSFMGLYLSTDNGENWKKTHGDTIVIEDFVFLPNGGIIAVCNEDIYLSRDNGVSWDILNVAAQHSSFKNIVLSQDGYLYISSNGDGVYISSDFGDNWELNTPSIGWAIVDAIALNSFGIVMIGGELSGCYYTSDHGDNWIEANSGLPTRYINSIHFDKANFAYLGLVENGVYKSTSPVTSINEITTLKLDSYKLYQNFPNPFNPITQISFSLPLSGYVTLEVTNLLGSDIATLVSEELPFGNYEIQFDASDLPAGIYFYTLQVNDFSTTKKMLLIK